MLESIPLWGKILGGVGLAGTAFLVVRNRAAKATSAKGNDTAAPANQMPATQPLLLPGAGTGPGNSASTPNLPLGGEVWKPPVVPLSENVDYQTAVLNANVQKSALDAQTNLQSKYLDWIMGSNTTTPLDTNFDTRKEIRGNSIVEGTNYVKSVLPKIAQSGENAVFMEVYNKAKNAGYSATEVAQSLSGAGVKADASVVRQWIADRGLAAL